MLRGLLIDSKLYQLNNKPRHQQQKEPVIMSNFEKIQPDDPSYDLIKAKATPRKENLNYRELGNQIVESETGTIIKVYAPKKVHSNIKRALKRRKIFYDEHYTMTFKSDSTGEAYYITVKG